MRQRIVDQARLWLGTPFVDGAAVRGIGADCAGLIEGLVAELADNLGGEGASTLSSPALAGEVGAKRSEGATLSANTPSVSFADSSPVERGSNTAPIAEAQQQPIPLPALPTRAAMRDDVLNAARHLLVPVTDRPPQAGDILLLAQEPAGPPVHLCLMTNSDTIIHAHWRAGVVENRFGNWFQARVTHMFTWPDFGPNPPQDKAE
ncbi:MAG: hypothetical protein RL186_1281 [Pseudomonadota bacterium]|jgi:cell wall-associated NlpC family hydrolase